MTRLTTLISALCPLALMGCGLLGSPMQGDWAVELVDADQCTVDMEVEQSGSDLDGEADVNCRLFFSYGGESYYYDMEARGAELSGDFDGGDFEITIEFYDEFYEDDIEITLEGEVDGEDIDGDVEVNGDDFGDFEGALD
jgi:hypothetical protein